MPSNLTFAMIKPDAVAAGNTGLIINDFIKGGFNLIAMKYIKLSKHSASAFYDVHKTRPFFTGLVEFMSSGPVVAVLLQKERAVADFRLLIGATDPSKAGEGTIRKKYATSIEANAVHGSDSDENAELESNFFFSAFERFPA